MTTMPEWLPPLVLLTEFNDDWNTYLETLYSHFKHDFVDTKPRFQDRTLALKRHPLFQEKEATFWHMITEGADESNRQPDLRRCERIRWPRPSLNTIATTL